MNETSSDQEQRYNWRARLPKVPQKELEPAPEEISKLAQRVRELQKLLSSRK